MNDRYSSQTGRRHGRIGHSSLIAYRLHSSETNHLSTADLPKRRPTNRLSQYDDHCMDAEANRNNWFLDCDNRSKRWHDDYLGPLRSPLRSSTSQPSWCSSRRRTLDPRLKTDGCSGQHRTLDPRLKTDGCSDQRRTFDPRPKTDSESSKERKRADEGADHNKRWYDVALEEEEELAEEREYEREQERSVKRSSSESSIVRRQRFSESELETDEVKTLLSRRRKQIEYGKNQACYARYLHDVPRKSRKHFHPRTPDVYRKYSRRGFDNLIQIWKKMLHVWEPGNSVFRPPTDHSTPARKSEEVGVPETGLNSRRFSSGVRQKPMSLDDFPTLATAVRAKQGSICHDRSAVVASSSFPFQCSK